MDDRNARSWWVPNEPSPKAPVKSNSSPGALRPSSSVSVGSYFKSTEGAAPAKEAREHHEELRSEPPRTRNAHSSSDGAWRSVLEKMNLVLDEASALCRNTPQDTIQERLKELNEAFRSGITDLERLSLQAASQESKEPVKEDRKVSSFKLRAVAKPFEPSSKQLPVAPALSWFIPLTDKTASSTSSESANVAHSHSTTISGEVPEAMSKDHIGTIDLTPIPGQASCSNNTDKQNDVQISLKQSNENLVISTAPSSRVPARASVKSELVEDVDEDVVAIEVAKATDVVWAEAEAWIEAEARAEDEAWRDMGLSLLLDQTQNQGQASAAGLKPPRHRDREENSHMGSSHLSSTHVKNIGSLQMRLADSDLSVDKSLSLITAEEATGYGAKSPKQSYALHVLIDDISIDPGSSDKSASVSASSPPSSAHSKRGGALLSFEFQSPMATSPYRSLHDKLSSPERRKKTPAEAFQKLNERLQAAQSNRDRSVTEIREKAQVQISRVKEVEQRAAARLVQAGQSYAEKLRDAGHRHEQHIRNIKEKANNENNKVSEVLFINSFNELMLKDQLQERLTEVESRILAASQRRELRLQGIQDKSRKRYHKKAQQMSEMRLAIEKQKMERWENLQRRLQAVQERRQARLEELQRRKRAEEIIAENIISASTEPTQRDVSEKENLNEPLNLDDDAAKQESDSESFEPPTLVTEISTKPTKEFQSPNPNDDIDLLCPPLEDVKIQRRASNFNTLLSVLAQISCSESECDVAAKLTDITHFLEGISGLQKHASSLHGDDSSNYNRYFSRVYHYLREIEKHSGSSIQALKAETYGSVGTPSTSGGKAKKRNKKKNGTISDDKQNIIYGAKASIVTVYPLFIADTSEFLRRALKVRDTSELSRSAFSQSNYIDASEDRVLRAFIDIGGLTICSLVLDTCIGGLCDGESLRMCLGYNDLSAQDFESMTPLLHYVIVSIDWCVTRTIISYQDLRSAENNIFGKLIFLLKLLLLTFDAWDAEVPEKASANSGGSDGRLPSAGPRRGGGTGGEASSIQYPEYLAIAIPLVDSISRLLCKAITERNEPDFKIMVLELSQKGIFNLASAAIERLHRYSDVTRGFPAFFLTLSFQLMNLISNMTKKNTSDEKVHENIMNFAQSGDSCITSNLVHLLAALVLSDSSLTRTNQRSDTTDALSSVMPRQMLCVALKAVELLNRIGAVDPDLIQNCPQIVKVSLTHSLSVLMTNLFQILEDKSLWAKPDPKIKGKAHSNSSAPSKSKAKARAAAKSPQVTVAETIAPWCPEWVGPKEADDALNQIFSLITRFCLGSPENQEAIACGASPSLLLRLCRMPMRYFTDERLRHQLLPVLVTACANHVANLRIVRSEMSTSVLVDYMTRMIQKSDKETAGSSKAIPAPSNHSATPTSGIVALLGSFPNASASGTAISNSSNVDYLADLKSKIPRERWEELTQQLNL